MSTIRPDLFTPPHKGNSQRAAQGLGSFYMSAEGLNQGEIPPLTALVKEDFLSGTLDTTYPLWTADRSQYNSERAFSGSQSLKVSFSSGMGPPTCGGAHGFGGKFILPEAVTRGYNLWFRMKMYIPSTMSFGHIYSVGDDADATSCGYSTSSADGFFRNKFIAVEQSSGNNRIYLQPESPRRSVVQGDSLAINTDLGTSGTYQGDNTLPVDQWFDLQMNIYAHETNGYYRTWINGNFLGQIDGASLSDASNSLKKFGPGSYWNGRHYTDGQAGRSDFWIDDVIAATDMDGYIPPTDTDSGGRVFISPDTAVSNLL